MCKSHSNLKSFKDLFNYSNENLMNSAGRYWFLEARLFRTDNCLVCVLPSFAPYWFLHYIVINQRGCSRQRLQWQPFLTPLQKRKETLTFSMTVYSWHHRGGGSGEGLLYLICGVDELHSLVGHGQHDGRHFLHLFCRLLGAHGKWAKERGERQQWLLRLDMKWNHNESHWLG